METAFWNETLWPHSISNIQQMNLAHSILILKVIGINDVLSLDFMGLPPAQMMITALGSLDPLSTLDNEGLLTCLRCMLTDLPMELSPMKVLITSVELGCSEGILLIVTTPSVMRQEHVLPDEGANELDQLEEDEGPSESPHR